MSRTIGVKNAVVELASVGVFGALAGGALMLFATQGGSGSPEYATLLSGFGGAILGSGLSAWVSFVLAKRTSAETLARHDENRSSEQKACALRLMVKASLVMSDLVATEFSINNSLSEANDRGLTAEPVWKRVLPIVGSYQTFEIDAAELSPLIAAKNNDLMGDSVTLFMQHRNLVEAVKAYGELRAKIKEIAPDHLASHEGVVTTALTKAQRAKLMPYEAELESLIANIRSILPPLIKMAQAVTYGIGPAMRKHFDDMDFPQFAPKDSK